MPLRRVYLDNSATTPVDARVVEAMLPYLTDKFGNASSVHFYGQEARVALDRARRDVAALINARPNEMVFLSGGTEANNLAIRGITESAIEHGRHIITSQIEHSAVRGVCDALERRGWEVTRLPVYTEGIVRLEDARAGASRSGCTRTRCRRRGACRSMWTRSAATCCRSPRTSSTRRKAWARS